MAAQDIHGAVKAINMATSCQDGFTPSVSSGRVRQSSDADGFPGCKGAVALEKKCPNFRKQYALGST